MTVRDVYETLLTMIGCGCTTEKENETLLRNLECLIDDGFGSHDCAIIDGDYDFVTFVYAATH